MDITGIIEYIGQPIQYSENFAAIEIWVTTLDQYPQTHSIQFVNDKIPIVQQYGLNQTVKVGINLKGRKYTDKNTGVIKVINSIQGWKIEIPNTQQNTYSGNGSAVNNYMNQPSTNYSSNTNQGSHQGFNTQTNFPQPQKGYQAPTNQQSSGFPPPMNQKPNQNFPTQNFDEPDDLPF